MGIKGKRAAEPTHGTTRAGLPKNVWALAWTAFFNDSSTEMSYWLLPQFLANVLGAPPVAFGLIEGAAATAASFSQLLSGWLSDFLGRRKPLAAAGYSVANIVKPLLASTMTWQQVFAIRFADRAAKGFRAAPRDALMADSVDAENRGAAFGLRQAMDTAGAIVGPLSAIVLLRVFAGNIRSVFWVAAVPGLVTILLAWFAVEEVGGPVKPAQRPSVARRSIEGAPRAKFIIMLTAIGLFSLGNSSDLFLILRAQNLGMQAWAAPALGLVFNVVYAVLSWPAGKLSDRVPRRWLVVGGYLIYAAVYAGFALLRTAQFVWVLFTIYGIYYALTEGVMKAWVADLATSESRASVYGLINWVVGIAAFPASLLAGWLWQRYSPATPFALSSTLALAAGLLLFLA
jgi:MFS family permease